MKYLQDEQLARWTSAMTESRIGHSRILHGRLEVYSMKRISRDKKYAAALGEKYVEQIHQDQELAAAATSMSLSSSSQRPARKRSQSAGLLEESLLGPHTTFPVPPSKRFRSCSLDESLASSAITALGDFNEQATRRLMTDLVLTLNASFPDYDFCEIKPSAFTKLSVKKTINRINESLSEWAAENNHYLNQMWLSVNQAIQLKECEVYKFAPTEDGSFLLATDDAVISQDLDDGNDDNEDFCFGRYQQQEPQPRTVLWSFYYLFVNKHKKRILLFTCAEIMRRTTSIECSDDQDEEVERFVQFTDAMAGNNLDFDLDPEANAAGGIPVSTA